MDRKCEGSINMFGFGPRSAKKEAIMQVMCESDEEEGSWLSQNLPCKLRGGSPT